MLYCISRSCMMRPAKQLLLIMEVSGVTIFFMSGIYCSRNLYNLLSFIFFLMARYHEIGGVRDIMYLSLSFLPPRLIFLQDFLQQQCWAVHLLRLQLQRLSLPLYQWLCFLLCKHSVLLLLHLL